MTLKKPSPTLAIIICSLGSFFYVYEFLVRVIPSALAHELMHSFNVQAGGLGLIAAMFFYGYMPMQIPAGFLLDKFGSRRLLAFSVFLCAASTFLFGITHSAFLAGLMRLITGFTASFAFVGALVLASRWFHPKRYAMFAGLIQTLGCIGAIIGLTPVAYMAAHLGWQVTTVFIAVLGVIFAFIIAIVVRDSPNDEEIVTEEKPVQHKLRTVFSNPQTYWVSLIGFAAWAPISIFATLWGVPFLQALYHIPATTASYGSSIIWIGIAISSPIIGWWSNKINHRRIPIFTCMIIGIVASIIIIYAGAIPYWLMAIALFLLGTSSCSQVISFGLVLDNTPPALLGSASGFNNMMVVLGGVILSPLAGFILNHVWNHQLVHGVAHYSVANYHTALLMMPLVSLFGLLVAIFFVDETKCSPMYK